jgi:hypothetical protein
MYWFGIQVLQMNKKEANEIKHYKWNVKSPQSMA